MHLPQPPIQNITSKIRHETVKYGTPYFFSYFFSQFVIFDKFLQMKESTKKLSKRKLRRLSAVRREPEDTTRIQYSKNKTKEETKEANKQNAIVLYVVQKSHDCKRLGPTTPHFFRYSN
eukprot:Platyproteum_vivax@DN9733_c0_g1_i1.p1